MLFRGSLAAVEAAETEVRRLGQLWLRWFREKGYGTLAPAFRLDFLVTRPQTSDAAPQVWTVEVCECGGSLCGLGHFPRTAACLNECLHGGANGGSGTNGANGSGLAPQPLPPFHRDEFPRHAGRGGGGSDVAAPDEPVAAKPVARLGVALSGGRFRVLAAALALLVAALLRRLRKRF